MTIAEPRHATSAPADEAFHVRWLGSVAYQEAWDLQQQLVAGNGNHLLLLEHPPVYTLGRNGKEENILVDPSDVGAEQFRVNRGGDVTFHGPGQLVGYPVMSVAGTRGGGMADTAAYVASVEQTLIDSLAELGVDGQRLAGFPGVWVDDSYGLSKIAAVGVRLSRGRSMHGFALNVDVDLDWFAHIVPCGLVDKPVTSLHALGIDVAMAEVVDVVARHSARNLQPSRLVERQDVAFRLRNADLAPFSRGEGPGEVVRPERAGVSVQLGRRLDQAGVSEGLDLSARKPKWMKAKLKTDPEFLKLKRLSRELNLVSVCEEAGCPNIYDCWSEGTATFMLLGERCTRACGFCLIDTQKPLPPDPTEPARIAEAVHRLGLKYAVLTMVARDDLDDGGANAVADTVRAITERCTETRVEVLISDLKGSAESLRVVMGARPDVINHNVETVPRIQRAVRPSASYARSLTVLARSKEAGFTTKSGLIVGMGETFEEVAGTMVDLRSVGVDIVTIGQYLRPTTHHLPVHRWWTPEEFDLLKQFGEEELGFGHVESSPLTRSSYHAGSAAEGL